MISLDFSLAIATYIVFFLTAILVVWLISKKQKDKKWPVDQRFIWFCSICTYTYINTRDQEFSLCPRCGNYNKKTS
jgi:hypothetical protein